VELVVVPEDTIGNKLPSCSAALGADVVALVMIPLEQDFRLKIHLSLIPAVDGLRVEGITNRAPQLKEVADYLILTEVLERGSVI
jgi:hypothetical protein